MIRLILIRHALTTDNEKGRLSGHINSYISEEGKLQINKITKYMSSESIDKIYTTPSSRTKDTIEKISKLKSIEIEERENLREISFGDFEGITFEEIKVKYPKEFEKMIEEGSNYRYPNGESLIDSYERIAKEIDNIILENDDYLNRKTILICSHAGTIRNIITYLISGGYKYHWNFKIDNASITILEVDNGFTVINKMNFTEFI
ncbi:histidine phosphatase family protein [Clostridioides sp. ZZV15-6388]|uniref:histidine phosphatase family protein n=1 Tax=unclassified Clostridioides TaxID=2635829 RepID=UPI001D1007CC|nr:histidine phosphatase family protein [Clostridioides sp. ZZV15-6388]MCC0665151.1 histidine phosphatase family protein [Clostridioides sp. ZZV15-6597]MCC0669458.1 histidine phosphatase family protein [Clostridioides sp. ZZV14-6153]MCC0727821.1 histidine phosphatase family protein [Clostridioides sp. ZZV14-6045]MCC0731347.1 histidine phosphatase family protein [Clostridioides sp. ZZV14-6048]MCC0739572.1 histidine phosphatase family protein [Clostridioides sp. ZZV14-5902]WLD29767.1 Phosphoser